MSEVIKSSGNKAAGQIPLQWSLQKKSTQQHKEGQTFKLMSGFFHQRWDDLTNMEIIKGHVDYELKPVFQQLL